MVPTETAPLPGGNKRRILSIDGGGIQGTFPAAFLAELEETLPKPIGSYFDLIAGTSTGGILAIALAMGRRASQILDLYERRGPEIFDPDPRWIPGFLRRSFRTARQAVWHKYPSETLRQTLQDTLGSARIGDAKTRLVIPAWSPTSRSVYIYKTAHHPRLMTDYRCSAVDAALATAAAPTYFPHHITQDGVGLIDGGIWANNPIGIATVEATTLLGWPAYSLHILSLGCLQEVYDIPNWAGLGTLGFKVLNLFMDGQSAGAMGVAKLITGHEHHRTAIYRINQDVPYGSRRMDDVRKIDSLQGRGREVARDRAPVLQPVFFDTPAKPFEPIYQLEEDSA